MEKVKKFLTSRTIGSILLVAGCSIGAGMLGLPVLSVQAGFQPSLIFFFLSWLFMVTTGLLFLEVTLCFPGEVNIVSMAEKMLGKSGKVIAAVTFLFLFYSLMVAYTVGSGELIQDFANIFFHIDLPANVYSLFFCVIFAAVLYLGTSAVDKINRLLMLGLAAAYAALLVFGSRHVQKEFLTHSNFEAVYLVIPAMIISFGYHNLIPSLTAYLNHDVKALKIAIIAGSVIPLLIYAVWQWLILGLISPEGFHFQEVIDSGAMATRILQTSASSSYVARLAESFAFFAISTSFLGVLLSFVDFLSDGLRIEKKRAGKAFLILLATLPPLFFAFVYPGIFLKALHIAGGFGAVVLFGLLPVFMVWSERKKRKKAPYVVFGGKPLLVCVAAVSVGIMVIELYNLIG